jgi:hypothetical protein
MNTRSQSAGTVQVRTADPPVVPARNQAGPAWPCAQFLPVVSVAGLIGPGIEYNQVCHLAAHSPNVSPYGFEVGANKVISAASTT